MTRIAVFTPTYRYGGLDVAVASLRRQVLPEGTEVRWIVVDSCPEYRGHTLHEYAKDFFPVYIHAALPDETTASNLCQACNMAIRIARSMYADLFVSLHDYTWIPANGLARFLEVTPEKAILAGVCHHAEKPDASSVVNPTGLYTVFAEPFTGSPEGISWIDCRQRDNRLVRQSSPIEWEPPWAAIGREALHDERLYFDEEFDKAFRYENQDFAFRALSLGYNVLVDSGNEAIQLPHWLYFAKEYADHNAAQEVNRELIRRRWNA